MQTEIQLRPYGYIYKITNNFNNKCYIGQSINRPEEGRWKAYKRLDCIDQHKLYNTLKKNGPDNFTYEIIATGFDKTNLDFLEDTYEILYNSIDNGYNIKRGGANGKHSEKTKLKISLSNIGKNKGKTASETTKQKLSKAHKGVLFTVEHKQNMSNNHPRYWLNKSHTKETKKKISIATIGENNPMYGKVGELSPMHGRIGELAPMYGRKGELSPWFNRKHSEETRQKMKDAWKRRRNEKCFPA